MISLHRIKDNQGCFPLHLLSMNKHLIESSNSNNLREFVLEIFKACPLPAITADDQGRIPFSCGMVDWIEGVYGDKNDMMSVLWGGLSGAKHYSHYGRRNKEWQTI